MASYTVGESAGIKKKAIQRPKKKRPWGSHKSFKGQWQANAQCYNNIKRDKTCETRENDIFL